MDALTVTDQAAAAMQKTPNRVSLDSIKAKIAEVEYHSPALCSHMTVAFVKLANGFIVIGESAPADPANFDANLGRQFAMEDAIRQIWPLEGYALRERMTAD
jgi:hypothetical protein